MENAEQILYVAALLCLGVCLFFSLFRAVRGPRPMDRVVGINMTNTLAMLCLAVCAFLLDESWLLDVCLIYGMISFLAVTVLSMLHIDSGTDGNDRKEAEKDDL
ncbi:MAG: sodium:proton antiporter [Clostridia bacterium]|nr:sodium:proton antiporter [Clostridia bacterium]